MLKEQGEGLLAVKQAYDDIAAPPRRASVEYYPSGTKLIAQLDLSGRSPLLT